VKTRKLSIAQCGSMHTGRIQCHSTVSGVNCYLKSNHTEYLAQTQQPFFYVLENFYRKFANLVAPSTEGT